MYWWILVNIGEYWWISGEKSHDLILESYDIRQYIQTQTYTHTHRHTDTQTHIDTFYRQTHTHIDTFYRQTHTHLQVKVFFPYVTPKTRIHQGNSSSEQTPRDRNWVQNEESSRLSVKTVAQASVRKRERSSYSSKKSCKRTTPSDADETNMKNPRNHSKK